jgi:hypothetical protein
MAIGVVTINIIGTSAGAIVPQAIGYAREVTGEFTAATFVISSLLLTAALLVAVIHFFFFRHRRETAE